MRPARGPIPNLLSEKCRIDVGTVNIGVAAGARRKLRRSLTHAGDGVGRNRAVALVAERVDARHVQEPRILRAVRRVATDASLGLDRHMLIHERTTDVGVALGADRILIGG